MELTLEQIVKLDNVLNQLESISGFEIETLLKLAELKVETEKQVEAFFKTKDRTWKEKRIVKQPENYDSPRYVIVKLTSGANVILLTEHYIEAVDSFDELLDIKKTLNISVKFKLSEFQKETIVDKDKKKISLATSGILKILMPFIEK